jgi:uncharacterized protein YjgD (DUF1641 family)
MTLTTTEPGLTGRIDELTAKVDHLTRLVEEDRATRVAFGELMTDSAPIVRSAYEQVAATLHERDIDVAEITDLVLRLAESASDLNKALETFQSLSLLAADGGALTGQAFELVAARLDELDRRGYFTFAKGGLEVIDRIVTSFDDDDIKALGDNVVLIFETVKEMTQPEVMRMLQRSARAMRAEEEPPGKLSMFRLLREMRDPEVKLGIYRMLTMLKGMASADPADQNTQTTEHSAKEE